MSMDAQDLKNAYAECLACDQAIFTLGGQDAQAQFVTLSNGEGRLHVHCRAQYEADNGLVVCESDNDCDLCHERIDLTAGNSFITDERGAYHTACYTPADEAETCQDCGSTGPLTEDDYAEKRCASCRESKEDNDAERAFERTLSGDDGPSSAAFDPEQSEVARAVAFVESLYDRADAARKGE